MKYLYIALLTLALILPSSGALAKSKSVSVDVSLTILPLFELSVDGPAKGNIEFGAIQKDSSGTVSAKGTDVILTATTNLRQPYMITHQLAHPITDLDSGQVLPPDAMTVQVKSSNPLTAVANGSAVSTESSTLYHSDVRGLSDTIQAQYQINVVPKQPAGDYRSRLTYTITTL